MLDHLDFDSKRTCRNCNYPMPDNAVYCSQCSQKYTTGKVPAWTFITEFFSQQLNIDSKLFQTLYALLIPGKLTNEYFRGKHKKYASPLRVFLVNAIIMFASMSYMTGNYDFGTPDESYYVKKAVKQEALDRLDSIRQNREALFEPPSASRAYDSLYRDFKSFVGSNDGYVNFTIGISGTGKKRIKVSNKEFAQSTPEEIADKYCDETYSWIEKMMIRQQVKLMKDSKSAFRFFFGKLTLILLLMMPFLALILKLLYIRRHFYYVEHLIFSFHYHAFAFLITSGLILCGKYMEGWIAIPIVGIFVYQFMAMLKVYEQRFLKTFLKFWVLFFLYLILVILFFILAVLLSLLLF